ncbi:MAG: DUF2844 domain-containing protein [Pseudomonadota bacterium]|nr:DUF2844 domain-containing protein [Pseudomonadota bacterium]
MCLTALWCGSSYAALGGAPTDFGVAPARQVRMLAAGAPANFTVQTSTLPSGTVVREYTTPDGAVFAVSWQGPFLPDLRTLLAKYFDVLTTETARRPKAGHSQVRIDKPEVTIESTGHMRAYAGRAWIAGALPAGFTSADIE